MQTPPPLPGPEAVCLQAEALQNLPYTLHPVPGLEQKEPVAHCLLFPGCISRAGLLSWWALQVGLASKPWVTGGLLGDLGQITAPSLICCLLVCKTKELGQGSPAIVFQGTKNPGNGTVLLCRWAHLKHAEIR